MAESERRAAAERRAAHPLDGVAVDPERRGAGPDGDQEISAGARLTGPREHLVRSARPGHELDRARSLALAGELREQHRRAAAGHAELVRGERFDRLPRALGIARASVLQISTASSPRRPSSAWPRSRLPPPGLKRRRPDRAAPARRFGARSREPPTRCEPRKPRKSLRIRSRFQ